LDIVTKDVKSKIENAFETLITSTYTYIGLLSKVYEERDISIVLNQSDDLLTGSDDALSPAEQEIYTYIQRQKASHKAITISDLLDYFSIRPYGWYQNAILTQIASLFLKQKLDLKQNSTPLSKKEVLSALTNNRQFNTIVAPRIEVDAKKIKQTKDILSELYPNASFSSTSTREIYDVTMSETTKLISACRNFMNSDYPFNDVFQNIIDVLTPLEKLTTDTLFNEVPNMQDDLLDAKDDFIEPIMEFMNGDKRKIYDNVIKFVNENQNNLRYIDDPQKELIENLATLKKPYSGNTIVKAKQALVSIQNLLQPLIEQTRAEAIEKIEEIIKELQANENFEKIPTEDRYKVIRPRQELIESIKHTSSIDTIKQRTNSEALADELNCGIEKMFELIPQEKIVTPKQDTVRISKLTPRNKITLKNSDDVHEYIAKLKENLLSEIDNGKQVLL
jgi:hypothetical protein